MTVNPVSDSKRSFRSHASRHWSSKISGAKSSVSGDCVNGHRGDARQTAGAKKFIRSRDRIVRKNEARDALKENS